MSGAPFTGSSFGAAAGTTYVCEKLGTDVLYSPPRFRMTSRRRGGVANMLTLSHDLKQSLTEAVSGCGCEIAFICSPLLVLKGGGVQQSEGSVPRIGIDSANLSSQ